MKSKLFILAMLAFAFVSCESYNRAVIERLYVENSDKYTAGPPEDTIKVTTQVYFSIFDADGVKTPESELKVVVPYGGAEYINLNKYQDKKVDITVERIFSDGTVRVNTFKDYEFTHYYSYKLVIRRRQDNLVINREF